jgi:hypothetical protein
MKARSFTTFIVCSLCALPAACGGSNKSPTATANLGRSASVTADGHRRCEVKGRADREESKSTAVGAIQPNIRRVYQVVGEGPDRHKVLVCREVDTNLDGVTDVVRLFGDKGESSREEADTDYDGRLDSWTTFSGGRIAKQDLDTTGDGRADTWKYYMHGKISRIQRDTNADGKPDVWEIYASGGLERIGVDVNFDGRVDRWDRDEAERTATATQETSEAASADGGGTDRKSGAR